MCPFRTDIHPFKNARRYVLRSLILAVLGTCSGTASPQTKGTLPDEFKPSLNARLSRFIQAQADEKWDVVASMLGRYRMGGVGHRALTKKSKACLVSQMKAFPMVTFNM